MVVVDLPTLGLGLALRLTLISLLLRLLTLLILLALLPLVQATRQTRQRAALTHARPRHTRNGFQVGQDLFQVGRIAFAGLVALDGIGQ